MQDSLIETRNHCLFDKFYPQLSAIDQRLLASRFNFFNPLNDFHRIRNSIFGLNFCTESACALAHGCVSDCFMDSLCESVNS
jgi:hypothetical protein